MLKKILKFIAYVILLILLIIIILLAYFNLPVKTPDNDFKLGITFSQKHAESLDLNWKETYLAILNDLKIKKIRLPVYWDLVEKEKGKYDFSDLDWQINEAKKRNAEIILAVGRKVPRWPECHIPQWIQNESQESKNKELLKYIEATIVRYKNNPAVKYWQVENEPFLAFGICPPLDVNLLDSEIALVKKLGPDKKIIVTDSGELSLWVRAAKRADIFGTTMYLDVYSGKFGHIKYPIGPNFFKFKYWLIEKFAKQKNVIIVELQGEPWLDEWVVNAPLEKQLASLNEERLKNNIEFAKKTGFREVYLWGAEWWYWLKVKKDYPGLWNEARNLYSQ